ncbi:hypothetical protein ACR79P_19670 [Sphingobacterium spiritivorum]|uniref:hypothetical protein n=1 Tax=Sphingobacterium spiritivorum TaxID=258 RepID=UPI003DA2DB0B
MERNVGKGLSPQRVAKILAKHGTKVNLEQAGRIQRFVEKIASMAVRDMIKNKKPLTSYGAYKKLG